MVGAALFGCSGGDEVGHVEEYFLGFSDKGVSEALEVIGEKLQVDAMFLNGPPPPGKSWF